MTWEADAHSENQVTVARLLERRVPLSWQEAVAITVEVGEVVERSGARSVPSPKGLELHADGTIRLLNSRGQSTDHVSALVETLSVILPPDPPMQLRLLTSTAGPSGSSCQSVAEFLEALRYFERPGRADLLAEVYQRGLAAPVPNVPDASVDPPVDADREPDSKKATRRSRRRWVAVAALLAAMAVGALAVEAMRPGAVSGRMTSLQRATTDLGAQVREATTKLHEAASKDLASVIEQAEATDLATALGLGDAGSADSDNAEKAETIEKKVTRSRMRERPAANPASEPTAARAIDEARTTDKTAPSVATSPREWQARIVPVGDSSPDADPTMERTAGSVASHRDDADADLPIFDAAHDSVTPPRSLLLKLPTEEATWTDTVGVVEAVVSRSGDVERVKLLSARSLVHEAMILSAVKTWRFTPAVKDGEPVRYRHLIRVLR